MVADGAACARAVEGTWAGPRQQVPIGNLDQPSIEITNGDVVGAVLLDGVAGSADQELPGIAHVWQDWDALYDIAELDVPCPEYYDALRTYRRSQFAGASEVVLEHLDALESFLDVCICSGYSLGASKSLDRLMQHSLEDLGEVCGREGSEAC